MKTNVLQLKGQPRTQSKAKFFKYLSLLAMVLMLGVNISKAQPWTYDFGTTTGTFNTNNSNSTTFLNGLTTTPTNGGTYRVRMSNSAGGSFIVANPGTSLGTTGELQITSASSTSTNKFGVYDWNSPSTFAYVRCSFRTTSTTTGNLNFSLGVNTLANDNQGYTSHYNNAIASFTIAYTSGNLSSVVRRDIGSNITVTGTGLAESTDQVIEVYANNSASSTSYVKSGTTYSLATRTWDLWVDGSRVINNAARANTLASGTNLTGFSFFAESSTSNSAVIYIDDLEYSNALPNLPTVTTPTATVTGTTTSTLGATVTNNGGALLTSRGTVWGTAANPTGNVLAEGGTGVSLFTHARTGFTANTLYTYRGYAINSAGTGYSADANFTTLSLAPTIGAGSNAAATSFTANWTAPAAQGAATYTYEIDVDNDINFGSVNFNQSGISSASTSVNVNTGLSAGVSYYYRVRAVNAGGNSAWSSTSAAYSTVGSPTISGAATAAAFTTTFGVASTAQSFNISGTFMDAGITVTPAAGWEVSTTSDFTSNVAVNPSSITVGSAGTISSTPIYVRIAATANVGSYNTQNIIVLSSTNASNVVIQSSGSGNAVTAASQTITFGVLANRSAGELPFNLTATASSGLTVTYVSSNTSVATVSGSTVTIVGAGNTNITASQAGNSNYSAATPVIQGLTVNPGPVITPSPTTFANFTTTYGTPSSVQTIAITSSNLVDDITVNARTGFEYTVGNTNNGVYSSTATIPQNTSTNLYVRLAATALPNGNYNSNTINLTTFVNATSYSNSITTTVSGNTVSPKALTITGLTGVNKTYDENTIASVTGTAALDGVIATDAANVTLGGSGTYSFASATVGPNKSITASGFSISGSASSFYTLSNTVAATNATANITAATNNWTGGTGTWNTAGNWSLSRVPSSLNDDITISSGTPNMDVDYTIGTDRTLTVSGGALTINPNITLVVNGTLITGGAVTLRSTAAGTASIGNSAGTVNGNVTAERYIPSAGPGVRGRYRFLASPVAGKSIADWMNNFYITGPGTGTTLGAPNSNGWHTSNANIINANVTTTSVLTYNEATITGDLNAGWTSVITSTPLTPGLGFRAFLRGTNNGTPTNSTYTPQIGANANSQTQAAFTIALSGAITNTVNAGTVTLPASFNSSGNSANDGWNLIGNPYPSTIDWNAASGWTKGNIGGTIWIFNPGLNSYGSWDGATPTNDVTRYISSGQAFFVKASATPTFSCTEAVKVTNAGASIFKSAEINTLRIGLVKDASNKDETVIRFMEGKKNEFSEDDDVTKYYNPTVNISSYFGVDKYASVNYLKNELNEDKIIPISAWIDEVGNYKLNFTGMNDFTLTKNIFLKDKFLNTITDVKINPSVDFVITSDTNSKGDNRFEIIFTAKGSTSTSEDLLKNVSTNMSVYPNPATDILNININNNSFKNSEVVVYNISGTEVLKTNMANTNAQLNIETLSNGVYFVKVSNQNGFNKTVKFVK